MLCISLPLARLRALSVASALVGVAIPAMPNAAFAGPKKAQELTIDVDAAEQLYVKLEYEKANVVANKVIERGSLGHDDLVRVYRVFAITSAILGRDDDATDAFALLLAYSPDFELDAGSSPKVTAPFQDAKAYWKAQSARPSLDVETALKRGASGVLRVRLADPTRIVRKVVVSQRWGSVGVFAERTLDGVQGAVDVATPPIGETRLDYFVQALDDHGNVAFENGSAAIPRNAFMDGAAADQGGGKSILASPVFWVVAGSVLAAGAVGGYFAFRPSDSTQLNARLGSR